MNPWLEARNLLAVRPDNIGDVVMLGPALRAVKETSPQARITLLASPAGSTAAPLLPWIDDVITWRPVWQDVGGKLPFSPDREHGLITEIARRDFDAALVFTSFSQTPHVPGYLCYLAGIPLRAGESKEFGGAALSTELEAAPDTLHGAERNLRLVEAVGFVARERRLKVWVEEAARTAVPDLLGRAGLTAGEPYILIHPGASAAARRYPAERYREVVRLLAERGWPVLVTGVEKERAMVDAVLPSRGVQLNAPTGCLIGGTTLGEYAALIERASLVMCGNTLPLHLADALETPSVLLYSGTDYEEQWRPRYTPTRLLRIPTPCHPCYLFECPIRTPNDAPPCLDIVPETAVQATISLVGPTDQLRSGRALARAENELTVKEGLVL